MSSTRISDLSGALGIRTSDPLYQVGRIGGDDYEELEPSLIARGLKIRLQFRVGKLPDRPQFERRIVPQCHLEHRNMLSRWSVDLHGSTVAE